MRADATPPVLPTGPGMRTRVIAGVGWVAALIGVALVTVAIVWTLQLDDHTSVPSATSHVATADQSVLGGQTAVVLHVHK
jgi:hypothetical protein